MFVAANVLEQSIPRLFGRSLRAEKLRAHVVIDSDHARTVVGKVFNGLRANETRRSGHDYGLHDLNLSSNCADPSGSGSSYPSLADDPGQCAFGWIDACSRILHVAAQHLLN